MKYIPALEPSHYGEVFFWAMVIFTIVVALGFITVDRFQRKENRNLPAAIIASLIVAAFALLFGFGARGMDRDANESLLKYWESHNYKTTLVTYGIDLNLNEFRELNYPKKRPTADEKVFGSIERSVDAYGVKEKQKISLVWQDGKIILAHRDDQGKLLELPPLSSDYQPQTEPRDLVRPLYAPETDR